MEYLAWIGLLYFIFGGIFLVKKDAYEGIIRKVKKDPDYMYSMGVFALVLGTYILATSGILRPPVSYPGVIVGAIVLVKSTYLILFPESVERTIRTIDSRFGRHKLGVFLVALSVLCFFLATIVG